MKYFAMICAACLSLTGCAIPVDDNANDIESLDKEDTASAGYGSPGSGAPRPDMCSPIFVTQEFPDGQEVVMAIPVMCSDFDLYTGYPPDVVAMDDHWIYINPALEVEQQEQIVQNILR
jgi:hypothetical protein